MLYSPSFRQRTRHALLSCLATILLCGGGWAAGEEQEFTATEWYEMALVLAEEGKKPEALAAYNRSVALDATVAIVWANRGTLLLNMERYEEALECYERSLALRPNSAYVYCSRATVFNRTKRPELALASADKALNCNSNHRGALHNKAKALEALGRLEAAESCRARAKELTPIAHRVKAKRD